MPPEELPESAEDPKCESTEQKLSEEAADFITSQVLDKGATFFGG